MRLDVGFVGYRGMVGSVLMQRMRDEGDFNRINPIFSLPVVQVEILQTGQILALFRMHILLKHYQSCQLF